MWVQQELKIFRYMILWACLLFSFLFLLSYQSFREDAASLCEFKRTIKMASKRKTLLSIPTHPTAHVLYVLQVFECTRWPIISSCTQLFSPSSSFGRHLHWATAPCCQISWFYELVRCCWSLVWLKPTRSLPWRTLDLMSSASVWKCCHRSGSCASLTWSTAFLWRWDKTNCSCAEHRSIAEQARASL